MSEMVERVARAMYDARWAPGAYDGLPDQMKEADRKAARAAIEAMRHPTELMLDAGWKAYRFEPPTLQETWEACLAEGLTVVWSDMIDAALKD